MIKRIFASTGEGRSSRNRSLVFATATSGLAKIISMALNAITIPIVVRTLGADGYGLWTIITSISSFLVFADFGLSNGLVAVISEANGKDDRESAIHAVSTTFFVLLALAVVSSAIVAIVAPHLPWLSLLNIRNSRLASETPAAVTWFLVLEIAIVPVLISQKIQMGYQEMHWTNSWQILGSVFAFLGVLFAAWKHLSLVQFVILFGLGPILSQMLASYILFHKLRPWLAPRISAFRWATVKGLSGTGTIFVVLQLLTLLGTYSDQIVLSHYLGLAAVAEYSLTQRLFAGASIIQYFLTPLWPAFGEAIASGDHEWARRALRKTMWASLSLSVSGALVIAFLTPTISRVWVPQIHQASPLLLAAFVCSALVGAYGGTMSVFLNNRQTLQAQLGFYTTASFGSVIAKIWLVKVLGISGVLWGTILGYGVFYMYPAWRLSQKTIDHLKAKSIPQVIELSE